MKDDSVLVPIYYKRKFLSKIAILRTWHLENLLHELAKRFPKHNFDRNDFVAYNVNKSNHSVPSQLLPSSELKGFNTQNDHSIYIERKSLLFTLDDENVVSHEYVNLRIIYAGKDIPSGKVSLEWTPLKLLENLKLKRLLPSNDQFLLHHHDFDRFIAPTTTLKDSRVLAGHILTVVKQETNFFEADGPVTYPPDLDKFENQKTLKVDAQGIIDSNDRTPSSSNHNKNKVNVMRQKGFKNPAVASKTIRISLSSGPSRSDAPLPEKSQPQIQLISTVSSDVPTTNSVTSSPVNQTASDLSGAHSVGSSLAPLKPFSCQWANCTESFDTAREFTLHVIQHTQESVQNQTFSVTSPLSSSPNRLLSQVAFKPDKSDVSPQANSQLVLLSAAPSPSVAVNGDGRVTTQIHSNSPPFIPENRAIIQTVDGLLISFHSPGYYIIEGQNSPPYFSSVDDLFAMGLTLDQINAITPPEHRPRYVVEQVISPAESLELLKPQDSITRTVEGNSQAQQEDHSSNERQLIQYETRPQPQQEQQLSDDLRQTLPTPVFTIRNDLHNSPSSSLNDSADTTSPESEVSESVRLIPNVGPYYTNPTAVSTLIMNSTPYHQHPTQYSSVPNSIQRPQYVNIPIHPGTVLQQAQLRSPYNHPFPVPSTLNSYHPLSPIQPEQQISHQSSYTSQPVRPFAGVTHSETGDTSSLASTSDKESVTIPSKRKKMHQYIHECYFNRRKK